MGVNGLVPSNWMELVELNMTSSFCGKPPNFPWRGSLSQWDQENSDFIRIGEAIFPGFCYVNRGSRPPFDTEEQKRSYQKWREAQKKKDTLASKKTKRPIKGALDFIDESKLGLADFM